jgi:hypothetical protein
LNLSGILQLVGKILVFPQASAHFCLPSGECGRLPQRGNHFAPPIRSKNSQILKESGDLKSLHQVDSTCSNFHLYKPQTPVGAVRELPLRDGLPIRETVEKKLNDNPYI